jgi:hypothetical protein
VCYAANAVVVIKGQFKLGRLAMIDGWSPGIGDPTVWGWLTVVNYLAAFIVAIRAARTDWQNSRFWIFVTFTMLLLGINKQLDLQTLFTDIGRDVAYHEGWYQERRVVQKIFIEGLSALTVLGCCVLLMLFRRSGLQVLFAMVGMAILFAFIVARAASFHYMDRALGLTFLAMTLNHWAENLGILIVFLGALSATSKKPPRQKPRRSKST